MIIGGMWFLLVFIIIGLSGFQLHKDETKKWEIWERWKNMNETYWHTSLHDFPGSAIRLRNAMVKYYKKYPTHNKNLNIIINSNIERLNKHIEILTKYKQEHAESRTKTTL